jgi:hypothetical protein
MSRQMNNGSIAKFPRSWVDEIFAILWRFTLAPAQFSHARDQKHKTFITYFGTNAFIVFIVDSLSC